MKSIIIAICLGTTILCSCTKEPGLELLLEELDRCVAERSTYYVPRERVVDSLQTLLAQSQSASEQYELYGRLVETYRSYDLNAQLFCTEKRLALAQTPFEVQAALLNYAEIMMRSGMYHETILYMDSALQQPLNPVLYPYYYHLRRTLYGHMRDFALTAKERNLYYHLAQNYRDSMMSIHPKGSFLHELVYADYLYEEQQYDSALQVLDNYEESQRVSGQSDEAVFAFSRAQIYHALGNTELEKHYLTLAAINDIKAAVREYIALRQLAVILVKEGDTGRAHKYMQCAIEDAEAGGARVRSFETGRIYPLVEKAYQQQITYRQRAMVALIFSTLIIIALLFYILLLSRRNHKKLTALNQQLATANANLRQSNRITTQYVGRYMETSSLLTLHFDQWRKEFYRNFDEAFLDIFPNFKEEVQALLVEDTEFATKKGELLNTDLRVLALIRLGITDSQQIASFLHYSASTIYNSRTRMRNLAKGDREHFEEKIAALE